MISRLEQLVSHAAKEWPSNKAVIEADTGLSITYERLDDDINALSSKLIQQGLKRGRPRGVPFHSSIAGITEFFAVSRAGGIVVLTSHVILKPEGLKNLITVFTKCDCHLAKDAAVIIYTSGTTGRQPLGVTLSHKNLISNNIAIAEYTGISSSDKICCVLPLHYIFGLSLVLSHFIVGGTVIIDNRFMYPNVVLDTIDKYKATGFAGVSGHYVILLRKADFKNRALASLRYFLQAGDAMPPDVARQLAAAFPKKRLYMMYGLTEAGPRLTYLDPELALRKPASVGRAIPGVEVRVVDRRGKERRPNQTGEIIARGRNIMLGYWNNARETARRLKKGWLYTGDIGFKDNGGDLFITGRKDKIIKHSKLLRAIPRNLFILLFIMSAFLADVAFAKATVPGRTRHKVNDYARVIDKKTTAYLEEFLSSLPQTSPDPLEVMVATFSDTEGWELADFALAYAEKWRLTKKGRDNGVILMVFPEQEKIIIGVGQNLKGILTDEAQNNIMEHAIQPFLIKGEYGEAVKRAAEEIVKLLNTADIPMDEPAVLIGRRITALAIILAVAALFLVNFRNRLA